jgi:DUF4097 and DUF4098 domain-containing protein YvlB
MRLSAHSRARDFRASRSGFAWFAALCAAWCACAVFALLPLAGSAQQSLKREGSSWVRTYTGSLAGAPKLRVISHGPVAVEGNAGRSMTYTVKVSVLARTEAEALRMLQHYEVRTTVQGDWAVLTTPGGQTVSNVVLKAPRLTAVRISTSNGAIDAKGIDGPLDADTGAGAVTADRVRGDCRLVTGGGDVHAGAITGGLHCITGGGQITARLCGPAVFRTNGGDINATEVRGSVNAETGAGEVRIGTANGPVTATTGGGPIVIGKANGVVTARNMAGPVLVGAAAGVHCESGSGAVRLSNISGSMRVSTSLGSIFADLMGSRLTDSFLATGNGDITVTIPSNVGVTIRAVNQMADTMQRIVSDYRGIQARRRGTNLIAEGPVNGGGPLLQISGTGGTIFIKRQ